MKKRLLLLLPFCAWMASSHAADGMINVPSQFSVEQTADRMKQILEKKQLTLFNRIRHSEAAKEVGINLMDTQLLIFGNPKVGSLLMKCQQSVAIDLPLKALVWQDKNAKVWVSYNQPGYFQKRHQIKGCADVLAKMEKALAGIAHSAAKD